MAINLVIKYFFLKFFHHIIYFILQSGSVDSRSGSIGSTQNRTKRTNFSIPFSNIRGLRSNFPEVSQFVKDKAPDMLAISETKSDSSIPSAEVTPDD